MLDVAKIDVWSAVIEDQPGGLKQKLEALAMAGADLDFIIARRLHEKPGNGIVFITPLAGEKQLKAAAQLGFAKSDSLHSLRVQGPDEPGIVYRISSALADEGINLRGLSAARLGREFVLFLAFDKAEECVKAAERLNRAV